MSTSKIFITPEFRMSYPNLAKPKAFQKDGKPLGDPKYGVQMLFDPEQLDEFKFLNEATGQFDSVNIATALAQLAKQEWPDIVVKDTFIVGDNWPVKNGDTIAAKYVAQKKEKSAEAYVGKKVISASANETYPPTLGYKEGAEKKKIVRHTEHGDAKATQLFAGGNYAFAEVTARTTEVKDKKYIAIYVNSITYIREGERLGGVSLMDRFEGIQGGDTNHDPTVGLDDDDIPF